MGMSLTRNLTFVDSTCNESWACVVLAGGPRFALGRFRLTEPPPTWSGLELFALGTAGMFLTAGCLAMRPVMPKDQIRIFAIGIGAIPMPVAMRMKPLAVFAEGCRGIRLTWGGGHRVAALRVR